MKTIKRLTLLIAALCLPAFALTSCQSTGDPGADLQGYWNSPTVQAELNLIQNEAVTFLNNFLTSQLGARRSSAVLTANSPAIRATVASLRARHPNVPDTVLVGAAIKAAGQ